MIRPSSAVHSRVAQRQGVPSDIAWDEDLWETIVRPVNIAAIDAETEQLDAEKRNLDDELLFM